MNLITWILGFHSLAYALSPSATGDSNDTQGSSNHGPPDRVEEFINRTGGEQQFNIEMENILQHASALHDGQQSVFESCQGPRGDVIIGRVRFEDNSSWAAKIYVNEYSLALRMEQALKSMRAIENHCPGIPIPRVHGYLQGKPRTNSTLCYFFTDWVEGRLLMDAIPPEEPELITVGAYRGRLALNGTIPETVALQLAAFAYNLITCPIPAEELSEMTADPLHLHQAHKFVQSGELRGSAWARRQFIEAQFLLSSTPSLSPYTGFDKIALLAWICQRLDENDDLPWALHYWDLRPVNIILDNDDNITIIDWDGVVALPLLMSALTLQDWLFDPNFIHNNIYQLTISHSQQFDDEFRRLEWERSSSDRLLQLYLNHSKVSLFLDRILLRSGFDLPQLALSFPELLSEALTKSPQMMPRLAWEWQAFTEEFFLSRGRPVPDWPQYVEVQQGLGLYGQTKYHHIARETKRKVQMALELVLRPVCGLYPGWGWASRKHCYLTAALSDEYLLPSGRSWC